jgi:hypothetical protein
MDAKQIRTYMLEAVTDHIDPLTGEINLTGLSRSYYRSSFCS